jgi:hypothetical protein
MSLETRRKWRPFIRQWWPEYPPPFLRRRRGWTCDVRVMPTWC